MRADAVSDVSDNKAEGRYELIVDGQTAIAAYTLDGDVMIFTHTKVPAALEGHGVGSRLIAGALADVRVHGLACVPQCPFVAAYIERHPDVQDLVAR